MSKAKTQNTVQEAQTALSMRIKTIISRTTHFNNQLVQMMECDINRVVMRIGAFSTDGSQDITVTITQYTVSFKSDGEITLTHSSMHVINSVKSWISEYCPT